MTITSNANDSIGQAELEPVVAGMESNVESNASNLKVPEEAAREPVQ